jgi:hypothetical protein
MKDQSPRIARKLHVTDYLACEIPLAWLVADDIMSLASARPVRLLNLLKHRR